MNNITIKKVLLYVLTCLLASSCIEPYEAELKDTMVKRLVVDGGICSDSHCSFLLSQTIPLNDKTLSAQPIPDAKLTICGEDGTKYKTTHGESGRYEVVVGHLDPAKTYWIEIEWKGYHFSSTPLKPVYTPSIAQLDFKQERTDKMVDILMTVNNPNAEEEIHLSVTYQEYWEIYTPYCTNAIYVPEQDTIIMLDKRKGERIDHGWCSNRSTKPMIISSEQYIDNQLKGYRLYTIDHTDDRLQTCYYTKVNIVGINQDEYEYEKVRLRQTNDMGGLFSPLPSELPTNIHCTDGDIKVIGFVGVRGNVASKDMYINTDQVEYRSLHKACKKLDAEYVEARTPKMLWDMRNQICYYGVIDPLSDEMVAEWCPKWGVDCTDPTWGASREMPWFWGHSAVDN